MPFKSLYFDYFGHISVLFNSSVVNFVKRRSAFFAVQERDSALGVGQYIFFSGMLCQNHSCGSYLISLFADFPRHIPDRCFGMIASVFPSVHKTFWTPFQSIEIKSTGPGKIEFDVE